MLPLVAAIVVSYLLGSIPAAYIAGASRGIDLRKHGSGNLGATNVIRVLGTRVGLAVFAFDMAKGAVPVFVFSRWATPETMPGVHDHIVVGILCGIAAIVGHVRPVYLRFGKGGKGVATAAGVFLALAPVETLLALLIFAVVLLSSGYVSLGSLTCAVMMPVLLAIGPGVRSPLFAISILVGVFVFWTHRANIVRLRSGEEHRFGKRVGSRERGDHDRARSDVVHGLLSNSTVSPVAVLAIGVVVVLAILVAARLA